MSSRIHTEPCVANVFSSFFLGQCAPGRSLWVTHIPDLHFLPFTSMLTLLLSWLGPIHIAPGGMTQQLMLEGANLYLQHSNLGGARGTSTRSLPFPWHPALPMLPTRPQAKSTPQSSPCPYLGRTWNTFHQCNSPEEHVPVLLWIPVKLGIGPGFYKSR